MTTIPLHLIEPGTRLRGADPEQVKHLAESIAEVGLLHPIAVYRRKVMHGGIAVDGYGIVAGLNRFEAHKALGREEIEATILALDELHRQLAEVDENLAGTKLTPAERALFTRRRKEIYEALHPETKNGATGNGREKVRQLGEATPADRFTADTAKSTGQSERAIQRDAARGSIGDDLVDLKGTSLDKGVELDALAKMPEQERRDIIARAKAGEQVTARKPVPPPSAPLNDYEAINKQVQRIMSAWNAAGPEARERFLSLIESPVMDSTVVMREFVDRATGEVIDA